MSQMFDFSTSSIEHPLNIPEDQLLHYDCDELTLSPEFRSFPFTPFTPCVQSNEYSMEISQKNIS